jgi:glycosyltransferase involved in cell wall biosynthesis
MSAPSPTFSLIIPTYNRAGLIQATLDSAYNQSRPFDEIIVVDDGSTDNTVEVVTANKDRVQLICLPNGAVQRARNAGVHAATGDYIVLCDSDDLMAPDYLETLATFLTAHPDVDAVYTNFVTFNTHGIGPDKFSLAPPGFFDGATRSGEFLVDVPELHVRTVRYQPLFPTGSIVNKAFYERIGGYDPRFAGVGGEDWEFLLRLLGQARVALCTTPLIRIRKHDSNISGDVIRQVGGCAQILEYALANHPWARPYRDVLLANIDRFRLEVFDTAYARGRFDIAAQMLARLRNRPQDMKFRAKVSIINLPEVLRKPLWQLTQTVNRIPDFEEPVNVASTC